MKQESIMIELFGKTPELRIIDFLLDNNIFDYTKTEIARGAGITRPTLYKVWNKLVKAGLVIETRKINRTQLYKINLESPIIKRIMEIEMKFSLEGVNVRKRREMKPVAIRV
ncbi:MAG: winged helix-turn-helix transcriptional regulator [Candidatus Aenigmarchaeota archaeon]|nr:winged helix-turn-helix transcriptional regulator [Candidatus Aenigmarchaeota archaeon]